jgi:hypothetical protein
MKTASSIRVAATITLLAFGICSASVAAQGRGRGHAKAAAGKDAKSEKAEKHDDKAVAFDRDAHQRVVREYYAAGSLPPGLAKRQALPPGLRQQLRERGALPPGLQKRLVPVPAPLSARLPPVPTYYHRYFAGDDFLVVDVRTNRIVVIIRDVWR